MRIIACPSCEKKLKLPDTFTKTSFKCPACGQVLKIAPPKSASPKPTEPASAPTKPAAASAKPASAPPKPTPAPPKRKRDDDDLVELEADDRVEDERIDEEPDDELFEEETQPRRSAARSVRGGKRPAPRGKRESSSKGLWIGLGAGAVGSLVLVLIVLLWNRGDNPPNNVATNNTAPANIAQQPPVANGLNPANPTMPLPANPPDPNAVSVPNTAAAALNTTVAAIPTQPAPTNPTVPVPTPTQPTLNPVPSTPSPVQPAIAANPNNALRYKWQPNREYSYKFSIEANLGEMIERTEGVCSYRVSPQPAGPTIEFKQQGSGTAFVVSADGFLLTCEHVVASAKTIEVQLGGQKYPATVVASDPAHDVALIRINAQNLTPVPLADSNAVQLGQGVRALGYPLTDVLGNNLKVTVGSVSGLNQEGGSRVFQVDAALNPGNSGGPVVNEMGEVIGVASAKLAGPAVSAVGMARPINDAKGLLQQASVKFLAGTAQQKLDGPVLAAKVSPSVALVHVVAGASGNRTTLAYEASFATTQRPAPGRRILNFSIPNIGRGSGTLTLDEFGEIVQMTGEEQLPFCMGPVGMVAIAPLNPSGQVSWGRTEQTSIRRIEQDPNDPFARMRARGLMRPPFGPFVNRPKETVFPAQESLTFTLGQQVADVQLIKKSYELKTLDNAANPYLHLKGEGDWRFHAKEAMPFSAELKFELARAIDNATIRVPFQMQFLYTDPQVIAAERKQSEERMAASRQQQSQQAAAELDKLAGPKKAKLVRRFAPITTVLCQAIQLTPDGKRALFSMNEGPVMVFDATQDEPIGKLEGLKQNIQFLNVSSDGKLACGGTLTETCVWNLDSRQIVLQPKIDRFAPSCVTFSADNQRVYFGFGFIRFQGWDLASGKLLKEWQPKRGNTKAVMLTPDGQTLIATDGQQMFHYDPNSGNLQKTEPLAPGGSSYYQVRLTAEGGRGVFVKNLASLDVISLDEPTKSNNIAVRPAPNNSFAISANGKRVAVADQSNKQVVVWDTDKNQLIDQWPVDTIAAQTVALSADGKFVLTCGYHKVLQLWELTE